MSLLKLPLKLLALFFDRLKGGKEYTDDDSKLLDVFQGKVNTLYLLANSHQCLALVVVRYEQLKTCIPPIIQALPVYPDRFWIVAQKCNLSPYFVEGEVKYEHTLLMLVNQDVRESYEGDERLKWLTPTKVNIDPLEHDTND